MSNHMKSTVKSHPKAVLIAIVALIGVGVAACGSPEMKEHEAACAEEILNGTDQAEAEFTFRMKEVEPLGSGSYFGSVTLGDKPRDPARYGAWTCAYTPSDVNGPVEIFAI